MNFQNTELQTIVPTKIVGPVKIVWNGICENVNVPMATFESPLWNSTKRGALISQKTSGINVAVCDDGLSRSVIFSAKIFQDAIDCKNWILENQNLIAKEITSTSNFAKLKNLVVEIVGNIIFLRINIFTGNASGHNMVTKAADSVINLVMKNCKVSYQSISGNFCVDKKNSAVNGILGRGKRCFAEIIIPRNICSSILKTSPEKIVEINTKKNLLGSILAGSVRSANAHFANILLAIYLATGQDAANIVEGSQGITFAEMHEDNLYFSVTIPNVIVGTIGSGKNSDFAKNNLSLMKCDAGAENSSERLAAIITAAVLCSELSLLAAQTNPGELMSAHIILERKNK